MGTSGTTPNRLRKEKGSSPMAKKSFRKLFATVATTAVLATGIAASTAGTASAADRVCSGTISNTTIRGDVIVGTNKSCTLKNVTVTGNVKTRAGSTLNLQSSRVWGNVEGTSNRLVRTTSSAIGGNLQLKYATTMYMTKGFVRGDLQLENHKGAAAINGGTIHGNVQQTKGAATGSIRLENARVYGDVQVKESGHTRLYTNRVTGNVQVEKNRGKYQIVRSNTISSNLQCKENKYGVTGGKNVVKGSKEGQCRNL